MTDTEFQSIYETEIVQTAKAFAYKAALKAKLVAPGQYAQAFYKHFIGDATDAVIDITGNRGNVEYTK